MLLLITHVRPTYVRDLRDKKEFIKLNFRWFFKTKMLVFFRFTCLYDECNQRRNTVDLKRSENLNTKRKVTKKSDLKEINFPCVFLEYYFHLIFFYDHLHYASKGGYSFVYVPNNIKEAK